MAAVVMAVAPFIDVRERAVMGVFLWFLWLFSFLHDSLSYFLFVTRRGADFQASQ
jgi:hypothetical protein